MTKPDGRHRSEHLSPILQKYVDHLAANEPCGFAELVNISPRYNGIRHLKARGLIEDITQYYHDGEPYTGPRLAQYVLTPLGRSFVSPTLTPTEQP